ncbi:hypothetical protein NKW45_00955 [Acetobacter orientalis]|uniref:hypothetical protein n=1 Tax=Acetobacter orientalis TaxID=146474 RepID=UPI0020A48664|nr:hypothetical protein [Acetobacter orientalis]MCP1220412.1 hypothetical protein [Acetobacter orientalis]
MSDVPVVNLPSINTVTASAIDVVVPLDAIPGKHGGTVTVRPGITTLVGPNGSGKTRALLSIQKELRMRHVDAGHVRFLPAGRTEARLMTDT